MSEVVSKVLKLTGNANRGGSSYVSHPALFVCDCVSSSVDAVLVRRDNRTGNKDKHVVT